MSISNNGLIWESKVRQVVRYSVQARKRWSDGPSSEACASGGGEAHRVGPPVDPVGTCALPPFVGMKSLSISAGTSAAATGVLK